MTMIHDPNGGAVGSPGRLVPHVVPLPVYLGVFVALLALTGLTVAVAVWDLGAWNALHTPLALGIAVVKALLVVLYFMHARHSERLTWIFIATVLLFLFFLISLTLSDYFTRARDAPPSTWTAGGAESPGRTGERMSSGRQ